MDVFCVWVKGIHIAQSPPPGKTVSQVVWIVPTTYVVNSLICRKDVPVTEPPSTLGSVERTNWSTWPVATHEASEYMQSASGLASVVWQHGDE